MRDDRRPRRPSLGARRQTCHNQPMALVDTFGRPLKNLRLSVTDRCNLRCEYCMPEEDYVWLPREDLLHFEEMSTLVDAFIRYDIHLSPAGMENWTLIFSDYRVIHDDVLAYIHTRDFPDGFYDLRSRAIADDGHYTEFFVRGFEIRNARPPTLTPIPGATPTPATPLETPTPTPDVRRIEGGQGFYGPDSGAVLRGGVDIVASAASIKQFAKQPVELHVIGKPDQHLLDQCQMLARQLGLFGGGELARLILVTVTDKLQRLAPVVLEQSASHLRNILACGITYIVELKLFGTTKMLEPGFIPAK